MAGQLWGVCEVTRIQASPRSEALLQPREWNYNRMKTFEQLFKKWLDQEVFTSTPNVCLQNNFHRKWIMPCQQGVFIFFPTRPQSFDLGRWFLVNTKSSTPVARGLSCLPTLTNQLTYLSHCQEKKKAKQLWNKQPWHYQSGCFSWMEVKPRTTTKSSKKQKFLEVQKYFG